MKLFTIAGTMYHPQYKETYYFFRTGSTTVAKSLYIRLGYENVEVTTLSKPMTKTAAIKALKAKGMKGKMRKYQIYLPCELPRILMWNDPRNMRNPANRIPL